MKDHGSGVLAAGRKSTQPAQLPGIRACHRTRATHKDFEVGFGGPVFFWMESGISNQQIW